MKVLKYILLCVIIFFISFSVKANVINSIDISVDVTKDGNAKVTEVWNTAAESGTELFKHIKLYDKSTLSDFSVTDEKNKRYSDMIWNLYSSFEEKKYKMGITTQEDGLELCWGISEYGNKKYTITYSIEGFIKEYSDYQAIYFNFINKGMSNDVSNINISISLPIELKKEITYWIYGFDGKVTNDSNTISIRPTSTIKYNDYVDLIVRFDLATFDTSNKIEKSLEKVLIDKKEETKVVIPPKEVSSTVTSSKEESITDFIDFNAVFYLLILCAFALFLPSLFSKQKSKQLNKYTKSYHKEEKKETDSTYYYRDIPCNKDIFKTYWLAHAHGLIDKKEDFLGALILRWIKDGKVKVNRSNKDHVKIEFLKVITSDNVYEVKMYNMMKQASFNNVLETSEFEKYCELNPDKVYYWFIDILSDMKWKLVNSKEVIRTLGSGATKLSSFEETKELLEEAKNLEGLRNYLRDFSLIQDKYPLEVKLWDEYLIYAQIFGLAENVELEVSHLYPGTLPEIEIELDDYKFVNNFSISCVTVAYKILSGGKTTTNLFKVGSSEYFGSAGGFASKAIAKGGSFKGRTGGGFR